MNPSGKTETKLALNLRLVNELMSDHIPAWINHQLSGGYQLTLDLIHSCTADEQHSMLHAFPEETMAYSLFVMMRATRLMDRISGNNPDEINRIMKALRVIRDEAGKDDNPEETAGVTEKESHQAVH